MEPIQQPAVTLFPKWNPTHRRIFTKRVFGDCLDLPLDDVYMFDPDVEPEHGDLVFIRYKDINKGAAKYFLQYNGRQILASKHPPMPFPNPNIELRGVCVMRLSFGRAPRKLTPSQIDQFAEEAAKRNASAATLFGYGSPRYLISVLGLFPPGSGPEERRRLQAWYDADVARLRA